MIRQFLLISILLFVYSSCIKTETEQLTDSANKIIENEYLEEYHGWLKYLIYDVNIVSQRPGVNEEQAQEKLVRLKSWIQKIKENPDALLSLRGVQEWAYESQVDGSGQPFMITIPQDYDPQKPFPVSLYMHGLSGNHAEHYTGSDSLMGIIELSVLGRSRGGEYVALSESDVLDVLDYVEKYWNIDLDRIHLCGGSMGGNGTYRLGSRYPHRFASARPTCGYASEKPWGNLITLPIYATHSDDDFIIPIYHSSGPIKRIQELDGPAIIDITTGLGHQSWNYTEGNKRANEWFRKQERPYSKNIKQLNFTAFDGVATRSWWAEITTWGNEPKPAKFILNTYENNRLEASLTNIRQLKIHINESPLNPLKNLYVSINNDTELMLETPIPNVLYLQYKNRKWQLVEQVEPSPIRNHTPGGPNQLYNGEALLIVYGTRGKQDEKEVLLEAAKIASRSSNAMWIKPKGGYGSDSIRHNQNLYGNLSIKADIDVTKADMEQCHLVLIGTKSQNTIVAAIADRLPVFMTNHKITFTDNEVYSAHNVGLGLVYYNPEAPQKLIFWIASNDPSIYSEDSPIPGQMAFAFQKYSAPSGHDCLLVNSKSSMIVASRNFDSKWNLIPRKRDGAIVSSKLKSNIDFNKAICKSIMMLSSSDFAFTVTNLKKSNINEEEKPALLLEDLSNTYFYEPIGIIRLNGEELLAMQKQLIEKEQSIYPEPNKRRINLKKEYTLALNENSIFDLIRTCKIAPKNYQLTDMQLSTALDLYFPTEY